MPSPCLPPYPSLLPRPISETGSGVKGLPEFTALIAEPLPSGASVEQRTWGSPRVPGTPPDNQGPHEVSKFPPSSPMARFPARCPAPRFIPLRPDSLQLPKRPPRISRQSHRGFIPVCGAAGGAHVSPAPSRHRHAGPGSPIATPHQPPLLLPEPRCSRPVSAIKYSWPCVVNKHYEFMTC